MRTKYALQIEGRYYINTRYTYEGDVLVLTDDVEKAHTWVNKKTVEDLA